MRKKTVLSVLLLAACLACGGFVTSRPAGQSCPFGHPQVREVPIRYGLLLWTPELEKARDNLGFWPGGCSPLPEQQQLVCAKCRYAFDPYSGSWEKYGAGPSDLERPVSHFIVGLPCQKPGDDGFVASYQAVRNGRLCEEYVTYRSDRDTSGTLSAVLAHMSEGGMVSDVEWRTGPDGNSVWILSKNVEGSVAIQVFPDTPERGVATVCASLGTAEAIDSRLQMYRSDSLVVEKTRVSPGEPLPGLLKSPSNRRLNFGPPGDTSKEN